MAYLDFLAIKQANPIEQVAEKLGLQLKKVGNQLRGPCPSGQGGDRALVITPAKEAWYSFGLQKGGDCISLVALVNQCSPKEAAEWLQGGKEPEKKPKEPQQAKEKAEEPERGFKPLDYLQYDHEAVIALGFDPMFAKTVGIGYAPRGVMRGYVAIPVRDCNGKLLGYVGATELKLPSSFHS